MFGPATSVTAFSKALIEHKTDTPLSPADTPDFSVGCLNFANGVAARITCSLWSLQETIACASSARKARSQRTMLFHYQAPVQLERFSRVSLSARKAYTVRTQPLIGRIFGVGGRRLPLVRQLEIACGGGGTGRWPLAQAQGRRLAASPRGLCSGQVAGHCRDGSRDSRGPAAADAP